MVVRNGPLRVHREHIYLTLCVGCMQRMQVPAAVFPVSSLCLHYLLRSKRLQPTSFSSGHASSGVLSASDISLLTVIFSLLAQECCSPWAWHIAVNYSSWLAMHCDSMHDGGVEGEQSHFNYWSKVQRIGNVSSWRCPGRWRMWRISRRDEKVCGSTVCPL